MSSPSPTSTRTCSATAPSPARASTTSTRWRRRWRAASPKTRCSATTCSKARWRAAALVTDVELVEDYPTRYSRRRIAPASLGARRLAAAAASSSSPRSGVPALSRWKMIDNLRRSLTPIFWVLASIAGWTLLPFTLAAQWQALLILSAVHGADLRHRRRAPAEEPRGDGARPFQRAGARRRLRHRAWWRCAIVLIAHSAWMMGDAIVRTLYRLFVSRQQPAGMAHRLAGAASRRQHARRLLPHDVRRGRHRASSGSPSRLPPIRPAPSSRCIFALFWVGSPAFAWLISRSAETEDRLRIVAGPTRPSCAPSRGAPGSISRPSSRRSTTCCRRTISRRRRSRSWRRRTSPTNIGVYLLSVVSARDFGWISLADAVDAHRGDAWRRSRSMERYRGHLYNWYDTTTLQPLLSALRFERRQRQPRRPPDRRRRRLQRMGRGAVRPPAGRFRRPARRRRPSSRKASTRLPDDRRQLRPLRQRLRDRIDGMRRAVETIKSAARNGVDPHHQPGRAGRRDPQARRQPSITEAQSARSDDARRLGGQAGSDLRGACAATRTATRAASTALRAQAGRRCASARANSPSRWISRSCCGRSASCCRSATASRSTSSTRAATTCSPPRRG